MRACFHTTLFNPTQIWSRMFERRHWKPWQLSFQLLFYESITLINPNTSLSSLEHIKQEFILFMNPFSISVNRHNFHQQNIYLHASSALFSYTMIYFNNPASTFDITILILLSPKRPSPKRHVPVQIFCISWTVVVVFCAEGASRTICDRRESHRTRTFK